MELVHGFITLLQPFVSTMTVPTFDSLVTVLTGWVFASRRTVTWMILAAGDAADKHYSTCREATAEQVIAWYSSRWSIEVAFHDSKQYLGFEEPQGWSRKAVERTAPLAMLLYSLIVLWFAREGHRYYQPRECPWYTSKTEPSFADMLATLRRHSIRQNILSLALRGPGSRKIKQLLENTVALAVQTAKVELRA